MSNSLLYILAIALAIIPATIWFALTLKKKGNRKIEAFIFFSGIISVLPIFLIQLIFESYPEYNFIGLIDQQITNPQLHFILIFSWVSITEEIVKQWIVRYLDSKKLIIQTINHSIHYSLIAALGFSFAENVFYFYQIGTQLSIFSFFFAFLFRSIFTTCAHLVFSGFLGYYYGIAKFSLNIFEQNSLSGKKMAFSKFIGRLLNISKFQAFKESTILKGLLIAISLHTIYNYLLEFNYIILAAVFIIATYLYLTILLKNKASQLILITNPADDKASTMVKKDEEVVIELLGMWFNQKKYVDVMHICERLLKRDPDNKVVQLFKAQAIDKLENNNPYKKILSVIFQERNNK